jgi:drug/metabolite transporter (DMT)-like permease
MRPLPATRAALWMLLGALGFSTMGALSRDLSFSADWRVIAFVRAFLMALFGVPLAIFSGAPFTIRGTPLLWIRSIVGSLGMLATFYTLAHLPFSEAITLIKSFPIAVALLSWIVLGERPGLRVWIAILMGAAGVFLIAQPHFEHSRLAIGIGVGSAFMTAIVMLGLNRLGSLDARTIVAHFGLVATATSAVAVWLAGAAPLPPLFREPRGWISLFGMGVAGTVGQLAMTRAFALGDPSRISVVGLTELLFALAFDRFLWHRDISPMMVAGMALVALPAAWILATPSSSGSDGRPRSPS